jgi:hemerythrin-like domain-containing protein
MSSPAPIKRSKSLVWLSRDHHDGLLIAWKIRQGIRNEIANARIADFVVNAFAEDLQPHFQDEENLLFLQLPKNDELRLKAEEQHAAIRDKIAALKSDAEVSAVSLQEFANLLEEHIRFEERILFPYLEKTITPPELELVANQLEASHSKKKAFTWRDEFWARK